MASTEPTLDCQQCGAILRFLTPAEVQKVAANPYNYVMFCGPCKKEGYHIEKEFRWT